MPVWEEEVDEAGRYYYYNVKTQVSQWDRPAPGEGLIDPCPNPSAPPQPDFKDYSADLGDGYAPPEAEAFALPTAVGGAIPLSAFDGGLPESEVEIIYPTVPADDAVSAGPPASATPAARSAPEAAPDPLGDGDASAPTARAQLRRFLRPLKNGTDVSERCECLGCGLCASLIVSLIVAVSTLAVGNAQAKDLEAWNVQWRETTCTSVSQAMGEKFKPSECCEAACECAECGAAATGLCEESKLLSREGECCNGPFCCQTVCDTVCDTCWYVDRALFLSPWLVSCVLVSFRFRRVGSFLFFLRSLALAYCTQKLVPPMLTRVAPFLSILSFFARWSGTNAVTSSATLATINAARNLATSAVLDLRERAPTATAVKLTVDRAMRTIATVGT
jgi:hypothetical protein